MKIQMHLGLGDAVVMAPIIARLAKMDEITIPAYHHNYTSVSSFFRLVPNVKIVNVKNGIEMLSKFSDSNTKYGCYGLSPQNCEEDFVQWFYRQAAFNIDEKEIFCPLKNASAGLEIKAPSYEYNFIHDDSARGFKIKDVSGYRPYHDPEEDDKSILSYADHLLNAKEIHCIDSSFLHLAESLPTNGKLFYHKYARPYSTEYKYLKKQWTIIE